MSAYGPVNGNVRCCSTTLRAPLEPVRRPERTVVSPNVRVVLLALSDRPSGWEVVRKLRSAPLATPDGLLATRRTWYVVDGRSPEIRTDTLRRDVPFPAERSVVRLP